MVIFLQRYPKVDGFSVTSDNKGSKVCAGAKLARRVGAKSRNIHSDSGVLVDGNTTIIF